MSQPILSIVMPCYNEQEVLPITLEKILALLDEMVGAGLVDKASHVLCVDDGSHDTTWQIIADWHAKESRVKGIKLAHNRGHQYALLSGLMEAKEMSDAAVSIDADLQDDTAAIVEMVKSFNEGNEIVYGVRSKRATDSWFKRTTAHAFYKLQKSMGLETIYDHADFRLMSRRALDILAGYKESNLFLRGIVPQIGLKSSIVTYERKERLAGESKYPLSKMLSLSIDGITSFSARPMRLIFLTGLTFLLLDVIVAIYVLISYFTRDIESGWPSLMLSVWFLGSLILIAIGMVGEYVGKIFIEVKQRPRYNIEERLID
ncbi:MAG: glycosyltransferase family 2 protein [Muribaculaceae bacterium]|nr:glycosyltransferase family 2 protein [Muribaculaceae bacterium]